MDKKVEVVVVADREVDKAVHMLAKCIEHMLEKPEVGLQFVSRVCVCFAFRNDL